ncbi:MAG: ribose-5 phosphate isomerase-related protein [Monoraphidium minutum]|nr:MAG: ribose-5 phosphate isomerase-related protein [Monoraphidium minutum]
MQSALRPPAAPRARGGGLRAPQLRRRAAFRPACKAGGGTAASNAKRAAAKAAVDRWVKPGSVVGIGTGEMVNLAVEHLALRAAKGELPGVVGVPSCAAAAAEAAFQGLALSSLEQHPRVDVFIEQANQIDVASNAFLKGARAAPAQPDLPALRRLLDASAAVIALAEGGAAVSGRLNAALPVAVAAEEWEEVAEELDDIFLGDAELWRRPSEGASNPRGGDNPYVSEDGQHTIVDVRFYEGLKLFGEDAPYAAIAEEIDGIPGVLAHGLIVGRAAAAIVADGATGEVAVTELEPARAAPPA